MPVPRRLPRDFNPRSLAGATRVRQLHHGPALISIHAPSRERHGHSWRCRMFHRISIHAPSRERHRCVCCASAHGYFNPRSLAGATGSKMLNAKSPVISIHAPSRERLQQAGTAVALHGISIHAPSRERLILTSSSVMLAVFQSTLPRGSDFSFLRSQILPVGISIHAPSRERRKA